MKGVQLRTTEKAKVKTIIIIMIFFIFSWSINKLTNSEKNKNEEYHTYKNAKNHENLKVD